jgi:mRNA-degrading endonuclease toxin of MazEF toxin-antitoxin module
VALDPKPNLVVRYDFLWKEEDRAGVESGKDRPCAIILASAEKPDGSKDVLLCAITHSPPGKNETAVKVPSAVAKHLGLDEAQSWIKTDQVNRLTWEKGRMPYGISQAPSGAWSYGMIPQGLGKQAFEQVRAKARSRSLQTVDRREELARLMQQSRDHDSGRER